MAMLPQRGVHVVGPDEGAMACNEFGPGRLAEPPSHPGGDRDACWTAPAGAGPLAGRHALVTSGPTHEPIDPVRYIANRSQRPAGSCDRRRAGRARRPGDAGDRPGRDCRSRRRQRRAASRRRRRCWTPALPRCRPMSRSLPPPSPTGARQRDGEQQDQESAGRGAASARIWCRIRTSWPRCPRPVRGRPRLVVGFAAETDDLLANASAKRARKRLRLDRRQRRFGVERHHGRRGERRAPYHRRRVSRTGLACPRRTSPGALPNASPRHWRDHSDRRPPPAA